MLKNVFSLMHFTEIENIGNLNIHLLFVFIQ